MHDKNALAAGILQAKDWFQKELAGIRTGRATLALLDSVRVEQYGALAPLNQVANLSVEDPKTIRITPWDKGVIKSAERALTTSDLGVSVSTDEQGLRVIFPDLTSERRDSLKKLVRAKLEEARITLRGERTKAINALDGLSEDETARAKAEIQKAIDAASADLEALADKKDADLSL